MGLTGSPGTETETDTDSDTETVWHSLWLSTVRGSMSHVSCSGDPARWRVRGFTLVEAVVALAIVGMALVFASQALSTFAATIRRVEVRDRLLREAENAIESVRGGHIPLATGRVELDRDLSGSDDGGVSLFVDIRPSDQPDLYHVEVRAWTQLAGRRETVDLVSLVWRP